MPDVPAVPAVPAVDTRPRRTAVFVAVGLLVALLVAGVVSGFASSSPDGLERVAQDRGFADTAKDSPLSGSPVADYGVRGVDDDRLSTGLAGVLGVGVTFALGAGGFWLLRRRRPTGQTAEP